VGILSLATEVKSNLERLEQIGKEGNELQEFSGLLEELTELKAKAADSLTIREALLAESIGFDALKFPAQAVTKLSEVKRADGTFVAGPSAAARTPINELETWARDTKTVAGEAYRGWFSSFMPDLEASDSLAAILGRIKGREREGDWLKLLVQRANAAKRKDPSAEIFSNVKDLAEEINAKRKEVAEKPEELHFLNALMGHGATLEQWNNSGIQEFAERADLWDSIRLRLGGDTDA